MTFASSSSASRRSARGLAMLAAGLLLASCLLVGCQPSDPVESVLAERNRNYTVELTTWFPKSDPEPAMIDPEVMDDALDEAEDELDEAADEMAEGETEDAAEELQEAGDEIADELAEADAMQALETTTIIFDVAVIYQGRSPLDGITVEVEQVDAERNAKESWLEYLATGPMQTGESRQVSFELEGVELEENDTFSVTLLRSVDPGDYDRYPEIEAARN